MKTCSILLMVLLSFPVFGQKKDKVDPRDVTIDSLKTVTNTQKLLSDSLAAASGVYFGVYTALKDKVFNKDFDPAKTSYLLDSIITSRGNLQAAGSAVMQDSLAALKQKNSELSAALDEQIAANKAAANPPVSAEEMEQSTAINSLRELKALLDAGIITQTEFVTLKKKYLAKL